VAKPVLITDSSSCIPPDLARTHAIRIVPILLHIGGDEYRDGVDLEPAALYEALERGLPVKSAAPSPLDYLEAVEEAGDRPAVIVTPASEFTRMHHHALLAAELAGRGVTVVDSRAAAAAHGLVVLAAAEAAGTAVDDVVAAAEEASWRAELVACLESLDQLRQSGHVPAVALELASGLGVRPVFRMRRGTAERVALPRSEHAALSRIAREWRAGGGPDASSSAVFHAGRPERARALCEELGMSPTLITEFSAAMAVHTGPGVTGVAWLRKPNIEPEL